MHRRTIVSADRPEAFSMHVCLISVQASNMRADAFCVTNLTTYEEERRRRQCVYTQTVSCTMHHKFDLTALGCHRDQFRRITLEPFVSSRFTEFLKTMTVKNGSWPHFRCPASASVDFLPSVTPRSLLVNFERARAAAARPKATGV